MQPETLPDTGAATPSNVRPVAGGNKRVWMGIAAGVLTLASVAWLAVGLAPQPTFEPDKKVLVALQACQESVRQLSLHDISVRVSGDGTGLVVGGDVPTKADIDRVKAAVSAVAGTISVEYKVGAGR